MAPRNPGIRWRGKPYQGPGFDALTAAHSRALATISADIAAAIRAPAT